MNKALLQQALKKAYQLGQTYWQQADSDYESQHRKSDVTAATFKQLVIDTEAAIAQPVQTNPAPGYCKNCKDYTIDDPLFAQPENTLVKIIKDKIAQMTPSETVAFMQACATIAQPEQPAVLTCKKCGGEMAPGQAIEQTFGGTNDFIGDKTVCTISPCGPGKLVPCMKCIDCGWSTS